MSRFSPKPQAVSALNAKLFAAGAEAGVTSRPKYAPIPDFGAVVLESRHDPAWSGPPWFNEDFNKFLFVVSGGVWLRTPEQSHRLNQHTLVHVLAHTRHSNTDIPGNPVVVYVIHYREKVMPVPLANALRRQPIMQWNLAGSLASVGRAMRQELQQMLYEQIIRKEGWEAMLISSLIQLGVRALRVLERQNANPLSKDMEASEASEGMRRVADYVAGLATTFYRQQSLDEASAQAGLSRRQFTGLFRRLTGNSWRQHLLALRLAHGAKLLAETGKSVTEIMFECGFGVLSHFHHSFRLAYGCSPNTFRHAQPNQPVDRRVPLWHHPAIDEVGPKTSSPSPSHRQVNGGA